MREYPSLNTDRLLLRQFWPHEAGVVKSLAGAYEVSQGCLYIPHPYETGIAETWIAFHELWHNEGTQTVFAITRREDGWIIGSIALVYDRDHARAELGYWIGAPFWSCGYATEAAELVLVYAFEHQVMNKVTARFFRRNPASGRVLEKIGMHREGILKKHMMKDGIYEDIVVCGVLCDEWRARIKMNETRDR